MKKITYMIFCIAVLVLTNGCSNFDEINTDPNKPTSATADMIASEIMVGYRFWNPDPSDFRSGNLWTKHTTALETDPNPYQYYYSYWPYGGFDSYKNLTDLKDMVNFSKGSIYEKSYEALAHFFKAWYGFAATLSMGDVPYSEAGRADEGIYMPKYDKQADVFAEVLEDFKQAESLFAEGVNFEGDILYNGDVTKWRKLCNAMQLKVLQTMSKQITTEQKSRFAEIVAKGNLMTGNDDNYMLRYYDTQGTYHPYWDGETTRLKNAISELAANALKNYKDRRLFIFAEPAAAQIADGKTESDYDAYVGAPSEAAALTLKTNGEKGMYSLINKRYVDIKAGDPMLLFSYAEQCFILAEAAEEGWITSPAKTYYENGVKAILSYYKDLPSANQLAYSHGMPITQDYIDGYFTGESAYKTMGTKTDRLHQIWMQRWLIDFFQGTDGCYYQFLRTGYPNFPLDPSTSLNPDDKTVYPKRWMYPTGEQTSNPDNYKKAVKEQFNGYDGINQVPWYLK